MPHDMCKIITTIASTSPLEYACSQCYRLTPFKSSWPLPKAPDGNLIIFTKMIEPRTRSKSGKVLLGDAG